MDFSDLFLTMEADLAGCHGGLFVEITPGCVDDCDVVFFVAYALVGRLELVACTFDGIGFGELSAVDEEFLGDRFPGHSFGETKIHVCG